MASSHYPEDLNKRYKLVSLLGKGGAGAVYLVDDLQLKRRAAVKVILSGLLEEKTWSKRFKREARILAALSHRNIVSIYDYVVNPKRAYIIMEYVDGESLEGLLSGGPIEAKRAVNYMAELADALAFAHEKGVLHRDIKPANIMISKDGVAKLMDFGLSKVVDSKVITQFTEVTRTMDFVGTPIYMAPEVFRSESHDERSDVYQLGFVLYELLTGQRPFEVEELSDLFIYSFGEVDFDIPKPSSIQSGVDSQLDDIVMTAMAKDKKDRYQRAEELAEQCRSWLGGGKGAAVNEPKKTKKSGSKRRPNQEATGAHARALPGEPTRAVKLPSAKYLLLFLILPLLWWIMSTFTVNEQARVSLNVDATSVKVAWQSASAKRFKCTVLTKKGRKRVFAMDEKNVACEHKFAFAKLKPESEYILVLQEQDGSSVEKSFRTSSVLLNKGVHIAILAEWVYADYECSAKGTTLFIRDKEGRLLGKGQSADRKGKLLFRLNKNLQQGNYHWFLKIGQQPIAAGVTPVRYPSQKPVIDTFLNLKGDTQQTEPAAPPLVLGGYIAAIDWSGTVACYEIDRVKSQSKNTSGHLRLAWAFRSSDLTRNSYCPVGALAAYDKEHFTAAFARQETTEFYCFSLKQRSLEWSKRKAAKLAPSDRWYSPLPATKEWCIVHPKRLNPRGKAIVEGGGLFFLHYPHKYNPTIACLDLSGKCLSWSASVDEHLSTMSYVIGSSLFSIGEYLACSYIYTEQDVNFRTEVNMMLYPAQRTTPRVDQIKVINTRHLEERQNIHGDKERKTFTLTAEKKLVEASLVKGKWHYKNLAAKLPRGCYLSGPIVASNGYRHAIVMKPNERVASTYFIALTSVTDKGKTILHEPDLCPTVFHNKPPAIRNFMKAGDYLVGIGLREIFAINVKTGRFGSWMHRHRIDDFTVGPDDNIILYRSDCYLEVLPISLIVAQGKESDRLRQPLQ